MTQDKSRTVHGVKHADHCDRFGYLHIDYVKTVPGYRVVRRCACKAFRAPDRRVYRKLVDAEAVVKAAPEAFLSVIPSNRIRKKPTIKIPITPDRPPMPLPVERVRIPWWRRMYWWLFPQTPIRDQRKYVKGD